MLLVFGECINPRCKRTGTPGRSQTHIDVVQNSVVRSRRECTDQPLGETGEILRALQRAFAIGVGRIVLDFYNNDSAAKKRKQLAVLCDELRSKSGLLRGVEFLMKDMYSFHETQEDFDRFYAEVKQAYLKIYSRLGLVAPIP